MGELADTLTRPDPNQRIPIGQTGLSVSRLSLGSTPFGNLLSEVSDKDAEDAIDSAWRLGTRYFDTAPFYGYGLAEERVGELLATKPRSEFVLSTKIGRLVRTGIRTAADEIQENGQPFYLAKPDKHLVCDYSYNGVRRSLEESLERLGLDSIDIVYVHDPDHHFRETVEGAYRALHALREQGVVKAIGAGMNQWEMQSAFLDHCVFDVILLAGRYSLLEQPAFPELLPKCLKQNVSIVLGGVFNSGLLAEPGREAFYNYRRAPEKLVGRALEIQTVCKRHGVPIKAAALQFPLSHPAIASVVVGVRKAEEYIENHKLFSYDIPDGLWADLRECGLLGEDIPTPGNR